MNLVALIPLTSVLEFGLEEVYLRTGSTLEGILAAFLGDTTSIILTTMTLFRTKLIITTSFLVGSLLLNVLLIIGTGRSCLFRTIEEAAEEVNDVLGFFVGGMTKVEQHFNIVVPETASNNLLLSLSIMLIPSAFSRYTRRALNPHVTTMCSYLTDPYLAENGARLELSHATSIVLLVIYSSSLIFQLKTHATMYDQPSRTVKRRRTTQPEDDGKIPQLNIWAAIFTVCISGGLIGMCSMCLVESTTVVINAFSISGSFVCFPTGRTLIHAYTYFCRLVSLCFL